MSGSGGVRFRKILGNYIELDFQPTGTLKNCHYVIIRARKIQGFPDGKHACLYLELFKTQGGKVEIKFLEGENIEREVGRFEVNRWYTPTVHSKRLLWPHRSLRVLSYLRVPRGLEILADL